MKHFSIKELSRSETASRRGINNTPNSAIVSALTALIDNVLDPLREKWGAPIIVTSGYRCPALNRTIGGASGSQHTKGEAADIRTLSDSREENMKLLKCLLDSGIEFDQVIAEDVDGAGRPDWIHVSFTRSRANRKKRTTMKKIAGRTTYINGIKI